MSLLSERIVQKRTEAGLSQKELAEMLGISSARLSNWEKGIREPDALFIRKIAKVLNTSGDYLLGTEFAEDKEPSLSPEALALARRYDEIQDPLDKKMVEFAVNIGLLRNAPHDARRTIPSLFSPEWFQERIVGPDPRKARDEDLTDRTHTG